MASTVAITTALFETSIGLVLIIGKYTKYVTLLLAGFTLLAAVIFHNPASWGDSATQQSMFMKNMAIMGGLLFMSDHLRDKHICRCHTTADTQETTSPV